MASNSRARSGTVSGTSKPRRKGRKSKAAHQSQSASDAESTKKAAARPDWGLLEPVRPLLSPFVNTLTPILTGNVVYGLLVGLLVATWFGFGTNSRSGKHGQELGYLNYPERMAAYEEMWKREESELWNWLEERVGLERLNGDAPRVQSKRKVVSVSPRAIQDRIRKGGMDERELREAIRVTEEKLEVLRGVVEGEKEVEQQPA